MVRRGSTRRFYWATGGGIILMVVLGILLFRPPRPSATGDRKLVLFCAAGIRAPVVAVAAAFEREFGVQIEIQYGGSNTLLNQLEVARIADLYLAADTAYLETARSKGLILEIIPLARNQPVLAVLKGNPKGIRSIDDLLRPGIRVALGNPDQAAIGRKTRMTLTRSGHWDALEKHVTKSGVFKPTVPDVANTIKIGSVDAGIIWSATASQYAELEVVAVPELKIGVSQITIGVTPWSGNSQLALAFARFAAAPERGGPAFSEFGFDVVPGDPWVYQPEITFFAGSMNRRALEPIIKRFEAREGVTVNTVYNGCGILTAQMRAIKQDQASGFPDAYVACDVYYLDTVQDMFSDGVNLSKTDIVMAVAEGNPKSIRTLKDLLRPGIRVAIGQPDQCTIGVLSRRLLQKEGLYDRILKERVVTQTATSAMLVPSITTGAADAVLAYRTDTLAEQNRVDAITIDSDLARAVQPFASSNQTEYVQLTQRLFEAISQSRADYEAAGFSWILPEPDPTEQKEEK